MRIKLTIILLIITLMLIFPVHAFQYYTIPIQTLTNSPADSVFTYIGMRLNTPSLVPGHNINYFPSSGVIEKIEIYDYSGTAGTDQPYAYYIRINNASEYLIQNISIAANERRFTNTSINITVNANDYWEIKRTHPAWVTNPLTNIVGGYILFKSTEDGYTIPLVGLSNSPGDAAINYFGYRPIVPSTSSGTNKMYIPMDGNITNSNIIMNSTGNSTAEGITFFVSKNGGGEKNIGVLAINSTGSPGMTLPRQFNATNINIAVSRGDYLELKRVNPTWVYNPLTDIVYGNYFINTSITKNAKGYMLYVQHITTSTTDGQTVYYGNRPIIPSTSDATNKIYIPKSGNITRVELYTYSGTAGTAEPWSKYVRVDNTNDYLIATMNSSQSERTFRNLSMHVPVTAGSYLEIKGVQPTWATNPATVITGGYIWIEYDVLSSGGGGDIVLPPVASFSANITSAPQGSTLKFFDQSNNTIPGTTLYYWNFTNGGTGVDSTDANPTFVYSTYGTYIINHTISNGGTTSKAIGSVVITGGSGTSIPISSFDIRFVDTSTEYPTSWVWNATNLLGNNTEVTFSTSQNPLFNFFENGNWKINLSVSNAFGTNTTNQTLGYNLTSKRVYFWNRTS